jgi:hypothetical protein
MDLAGWISVAINVLILALVLGGRKWIEASVEKRVQHKFDQKLEAAKTELRKNEEAFKGDLRAKEAEISALRDAVLSGREQRQALLDKRRIEAVERIWEAAGRLAPFHLASATMARINFDEAAKRAPRRPELRNFFNLIAPTSHLDPFKTEKKAIHEQPFLSPLAWAYYSAYQSILMGAYLEARMLAEGVEDAGKLLKRDHAKELLKAALPHQREFIETNDPSAYNFLLDELKDCLLAELKRMLDGKEADRDAIDHAKQIASAVKRIETDRAEQNIATVEAELKTP